MSRRWSAPLEALGRLGLPRLLPASLFRRAFHVGDPKAADARGGSGWRAYRDAAPGNTDHDSRTCQARRDY